MSAVRTLEHFFIPLADGTRLAARLWLPADAEARPVPAILEYIPYRKRDGTRGRDEPMHGWFAENGYAAIRVDMRGSGESDGLMDDEYLPRELDDACEVIAWLAAQPWCSGSVGMMGKSWGGFNCLQVAALRPPALKAIITVCSTDDRYADDIHFMGGTLLNDNLWWGAIMLAYQGRSADPALVGEGWYEQWLRRLEHLPFFPALWLAHQRRDAYWRHGSICEDFSAIACPVFAVGGWGDAYTNAIPRMLEGLGVPRLGLIGPWAHIYPQDGVPGPAIGFLQEAVRWWDHWLKGEDRGIMAEPMLRAFVEEWTPPGHRDPVPGRFVGEAVWPSPRIGPRTFHLGPGALLAQSGSSEEIAFSSPAWTGSAAGEWMGTGVPGEEPADQRHDDAFSCVFDSDALTERLELLGGAELEVALSSDKPLAQLCVRLCDVAPDGSSRRVAYAVLNLTHRDSHAEPEALVPGRFYDIGLKLSDCGYAFAPGHKVRLAFSTAYWPLIWPAPEVATLTLRCPGRLHLPVRAMDTAEPAVTFEPPRSAARAPVTQVALGRMTRTHTLDLLTDTATYVTHGEGGLFGEGVLRFDDIDTTLSHSLRRELTVKGSDPLSARYRLTQEYEMGRENWAIRLEISTSMRASADVFFLEGEVKAFANGILAAERRWEESLARDLL
ncbi:CocE/NonD family hydrolase [Labrys monachus]|uniref:CocE/NonD family hydrolase n=1 Tax=Labrys monachus TaxID=217067 RepID=A0ABU0F852_9HYPH|nr:CocE/NonD family hydrolase [Labrys monachus]MDQ0390616.1 putative CocE/NonD family hydrolase [Labrys monachus]